MSRKRSRLAAGRSAGHAHPVDRSLLVFMAVLLLQSAVSIFLPGELPQTAGNIDVVIRTSSAAIFGYFLSANFARADPSDGQTPPTRETHILETGAGMPIKTNAPKAQIGFSADAAGTETDRTLPLASSEETVQHAAGDCMQVAIAAAIGLFCLVTLLALRNLVQMGVISTASESVMATITQFRDFISGCVGFLIGSPTRASNQTK